MLSDDLYAHLAAKARHGEILAILGGPNCRTWSILLHKPLPNGTPGHPLRGREEPACWGLGDLTPEERLKTDDDSILALRLLELYAIARDHEHDPAFLMEHPEDPAVHSVEPTADTCSTIWETNAAQAFQHTYGMLLTSFPQSALGGRSGPKWTTLMYRHLGGLRQLAQLQHDDKVIHTHVHSSNTARWAPGLTQAIAHQLAKALPEMKHWTNQASTDRPRDTVATPSKHHTPDIQVTIGHKQRPLRDGGGKPSPGRKHPTQRSHPLRGLGTAMLAVATTEMATSPEVRAATLDLAGGRCKECPYNETHVDRFRSIIAEYANCDMHCHPGQPFCLNALTALATIAGDPDAHFPRTCIEGVPLGVEEYLPDVSHIWPNKTELADEDALQQADHEQPPPPHQADNYPSAREHEGAIEATYAEEVQLGLVEGPLNEAQAAETCRCTPNELCHGALAGKLEGRYLDKLRTIHDGTVNCVNPWIQLHQRQRTTAPTLADLMLALGLTRRIRRRLIKLDASKAHRRIKVLPKDWRYMTARTSKGIWVNKVGTYGVASAQFHWGRMAALLLRLIYYAFPQVLWAFVYVDDFAAIVPEDEADPMLYTLLLFLQALGLPVSWKKVEMGQMLGWLGYMVNVPTLTALLTPDKQTTIIIALRLFQGDEQIDLDKARSIAGRLNWATMVYPPMRAFLQPVFAWVAALLHRQERQRTAKVMARTPHRLRIAAQVLEQIFRKHIPPHRPVSRIAALSAATDAGARDSPEGPEAYIGGWYSAPCAPKSQAHWFYIQILPGTHAWAYEKGHPRLCIAALELYATLLLYRHITSAQPAAEGAVCMTLALQTDNRGNAYQATNHKAHNDLAANLLMELAFTQYVTRCPLALSHTYRENNTWADQLTHADATGYDTHNRIYPSEADWHVLQRLTGATRAPHKGLTSPPCRG